MKGTILWAGIILAAIVRPGQAATDTEEPWVGAASQRTIQGIQIVKSRVEVRPGVVDLFSGIRIGPGSELDLLRAPRFDRAMRQYLGMPLAEESIRAVQSGILRFYRDQGRPLVDVICPPQDSVNEGVLQIWVLEGKILDIAIEDKTGQPYTNGWYKPEFIRKRLRQPEGQPLDQNQLRADLDWLNVNQEFRQVSVSLEQGEALGEANLALQVDDRWPYKVYAGFQNLGTEFIGEEQWFAGVRWGNAFGLDHVIGYQFTGDLEMSHLWAHSGEYTAPLPWRHRATVFGVYAETEGDLPLPDYQQKGVDYQVSLRYAVPLPKFRAYRHEASAGFDFKRGNSDLRFGGFSAFETFVDVAQFTLGYYGQLPDPYGQTTLGATLYYSPGGLTKYNDDPSYEAFRALADPEYFYGRFRLERLNRLPQDFSLLLRGETQVATRNLLTYEQLGAGGFNTVRGYQERESNGDEGWLASAELRTPAWAFGSGDPLWKRVQFQVLGFWDFGWTSQVDPLPGEDPSHTLMSVGGGLRLEVGRILSGSLLSVRFDYGWQLRDSGVDTGRDKPNSRGHIVASLSF